MTLPLWVFLLIAPIFFALAEFSWRISNTIMQTWTGKVVLHCFLLGSATMIIFL